MRAVERARPALIINAAAYNAVDLAESAPAAAFAVNAHGPGHLAAAATRWGARLIHVSTDYVFDGRQAAPYGEDAPARPLNVYGQSKREGERAVLQACADAIVLRTAWLYSEYGSNFVKALLDRAAGAALRALPPTDGSAPGGGSPRLPVVDDQTGSPTYAGDLAQALIGLAALPAVPGGIYHFAGAAILSRYEFAQLVFRHVRAIERGFAGPAPTPVPSSQYPGAAPRPGYSALSCEKIRGWGIVPSTPDENLRRVVQVLWRR